MRSFDEQPCMVKLGMTRQQRSLISKLFCGILPLEVETGRYQGVKRELRYCRVCESGAVEDEVHFLFRCPPLKDSRKDSLTISKENEEEEVTEEECIERLKELVKEERLKEFVEHLEILFNARQRILYK